MPDESPLSRLKKARIVRVLLVYLGASWGVLEVTDVLGDALDLPGWVTPVAFVLLLAGLIIILATAWVQAHPLVETRERADEVPGSWEVAAGELVDAVKRGRMPHLTWARVILGGVFAFWLLFGLAGLYVVVQDRGESFAPTEAVADEAGPGIAVLPFSASGEGLGVWREGLVDLLATSLDGVGGLRTIDARTVMARWRESVPGDAEPDLATALRVARGTGARFAVVGSAVALGPEVTLAAEIHDLDRDEDLGSVDVSAPRDSVMTLVDELSVEIAREILPEGAPGLSGGGRLASVTTRSLPALRAFVEGEARFRRTDFAGAIEAYERAVREDSSFALAWTRLSSSWGWMESISRPEVEEYARRALRHIDRLPAREALILRGDRALTAGTLAGLEPLREAVRRFPDDPEAWYQLGDTYAHLGAQALVPFEEWIGPFERAVELDPAFVPYYLHLVDLEINWGDSARAAGLIERMRRQGASADRVERKELALDLVLGSPEAREAAAETVAGWPEQRAVTTVGFLLTPRTRAAREAVLRRTDRTDMITRIFYVFALAEGGKLEEALAAVRETLEATADEAFLLYVLRAQGVPVPPGTIEEAMGRASPTDALPVYPLVRGAVAADRGRWSVHDSTVAEVRSRAAAAAEAGDTVTAGRLRGLGRALEGYRRWREGDRAGAVSLLERARREVVGFQHWGGANQIVRWWLADLHEAMGDTASAIPYLRAERTAQSALGLYRLGRAYEATGEPGRAREAYEDFLVAWADADPDLPWPDRARAALERLDGGEPVAGEGAL